MGWPLVQIFILRLIDHFWWLLGIAFMVEPWLDAHVERYHERADKYISRQARARMAWTVSIACLFIGSTWAFSDEYWQHQGDLNALHHVQNDDGIQRQRGDDLYTSIHGRGGYLDQIAMRNKPALPVLQIVKPKATSDHRSKFSADLQRLYADGGVVMLQFAGAKTDGDIADERAKFLKWTSAAELWICEHMGASATSKMTNIVSEPLSTGPYTTRIDAQQYVLIEMISRERDNLEYLIEHNTFDPLGIPTLPPQGCRKFVGGTP